MIYVTKNWLIVVLSLIVLTGCADPWDEVNPNETIHGVLDIPMQRFHEDPEHYLGTVIEDRFKFYRIYHDRETYNPEKREQVIEGKTHFTARPIQQALQMIQIQITPRQERWIKKMGIERQDVVKARIRFAGIAPGEAAAFDLLEILEPREQ